jgi:hypothetical protein
VKKSVFSAHGRTQTTALRRSIGRKSAANPRVLPAKPLPFKPQRSQRISVKMSGNYDTPSNMKLLSQFFLFLMAFPLVANANEFRLSRRALLLGAGATTLTRIVSRTSPTPSLPADSTLARLVDLMPPTIDPWKRRVMSEYETNLNKIRMLQTQPSWRIVHENVLVPDHLAKGWNSVDFFDLQQNQIPGFMRILTRSTFEFVYKHLMSGDFSQAWLSISGTDDACRSLFLKSEDPMPPVLILEENG